MTTHHGGGGTAVPRAAGSPGPLLPTWRDLHQQIERHSADTQYVEGMSFNNMAMMLPWLTHLIGEDRELLGSDWWPYGIAANRIALDAVLRYHHEQGLTKRRFTIEDIFVPELLDT